MPRRPRPTGRALPKSNRAPEAIGYSHIRSRPRAPIRNDLHAKQTRPKAIDFLSEEGTGDSGSEEDDSDGGGASGDDSPDDVIDGVSQADSNDDDDGQDKRSEEEDDGDADAPRISQWVDDETLDEDSVEEEESGESEDEQDVRVVGIMLSIYHLSTDTTS